MLSRLLFISWQMKTANSMTVAAAERPGVAAVVFLCLFGYGCGGGAPLPEKAAMKAPPARPPELYRVTFDTSKGPFVVEVTRAWAPRGADHFFDLVQTGFYDGARFFRVVRGYVVQFGVNGDPSTNRLWSTTAIPDDPVRQSNAKGTLTYAQRGPGSRTTQVFINLKDNKALDKDGFAPFGKVVSGMEVVEALYNSYGDMPPRGNGPDPQLIETQGNRYLETRFPRLDFIIKATLANTNKS
jgi:peptidyl-prolyl cis-trans isomerase A (cyclophilin A)